MLAIKIKRLSTKYYKITKQFYKKKQLSWDQQKGGHTQYNETFVTAHSKAFMGQVNSIN